MGLKPYFIHCFLPHKNMFILDIGDQITTFVCPSKGTQIAYVNLNLQ